MDRREALASMFGLTASTLVGIHSVPIDFNIPEEKKNKLTYNGANIISDKWEVSEADIPLSCLKINEAMMRQQYVLTVSSILLKGDLS